MSMNLSIFRVLMRCTGYDSVYFASQYATKMGPTGIAWGLVIIPVIMDYPVVDGKLQRSKRHTDGD